MATTRTPATRRVIPSSSSSPPPIAGSTTSARSARSAVPARVSAGPLSSSLKRTPSRSSPTPSANGEVIKASKDALEAALKRETEEKESLLLKLQAHEQTIASLTHDNDGLTSSLSAAENRLSELYADQTRMEEELAARLEVIDKLREAVKELEREKRDALRRYNEQTATFEAERQAFYDSEQHLKSRIQSLSHSRRRSPPRSPSIATISATTQDDDNSHLQVPEAPAKPDEEDDQNVEDTEPAEMTALRLELTTLSTSHASVQSTLHLLQSQLNDLKRVNNELQEENESYNILLRERTLNGQFDIRAAGGQGSDDEDAGPESPAEDRIAAHEGRPSSIRSRTLDAVPEGDEPLSAVPATARREESPSSRHSKRSRRGGPKPGSPVLRGESLADLPVAGPGLDLAAELGRAENKDILEGRVDPPKSAVPPSPQVDHNEVQALRSEIKALKDANKALSLYASKIIDRIIAQEGFEHVLAADYEAQPKPKSKPKPAPAPPPPEEKPKPKARPVSSFFPSRSNSISLPVPTPEVAPNMSRASSDSVTTTLASSAAMAPAASAPEGPTPSAAETASEKRARRGLSMDWKGITGLFGGSSAAPAEAKNDKLRPLTLKPGAPITSQSAGTSVPNARKVETIEDENDRKERERMLATMKLMGIETPAPVPSGTRTPPTTFDLTSPANEAPPNAISPPSSSRVPFFTRFRADPTPQTPPPPLTAEALEQAEAASTLAALDAREKTMLADYAKGKSTSGFTELNSGRISDGYRKRSSQKSASLSGGKGRVSLDVADDAASGHSRTGSVNTLFSAGTAE